MNFNSLKIKNIDFVINHKDKSFKWVSENRENHIIGVTLSGSADHDFGYKKMNIAKNDIYFLNQKDDYKVNVLEKGECISVHFTTYEPIDTDSFCIKMQDIKDTIALLDKIKIHHSKTTNGHNMAMSYLYRLCANFEEIRQKKYSPKDDRMVKAKEYIDVHFKEKDCIAIASSTCDISRRRFNDLFKEQFDTTPNRYLTMRKIDFAKQLLKTGWLALAEISDLCGFDDVYYFNKVFKKETGYTPGQYRKNK